MKDEKWVLPSKELSPLDKRVIKMDTAMGVMETMQGEETLIALSLSAKALNRAESDLIAALDILASLVADERPCRADSVHTIKMFLQQFKHPTP